MTRKRSKSKPEGQHRLPEDSPGTTVAAGRRWFIGPVAIAALAVASVLATLAPEAGGPGVACDEPYHVAYGKRLVMAWRQQGLAFFRAENIAENFDWKPGGPPVHPPLGNWLLGWTQHLFDLAPDDPTVLSIVAARFAPALAFGLLVLLVGLWTARAEGAVAGTTAAAAVFLVPRMFGHAHLAALDMFTALFFVAAALAVIEAERRGRWWGFVLAGVVWGMAMLVRLHGVLLLPPVVAWLVWRRRVRAIPALAAWAATGMATLYAGWPWLWLAPVEHFRQFLGTATGRQAIQVFYLGQAWPDHAVPRHYALVMFVVTLPLGLLLLGILGAWSRRHFSAHPACVLILGLVLFVLAVFSLPGTPVYDGERLFLMTFPLWAVLAGVGAKWLIEHPVPAAWPSGLRLVALAALVACQGLGIVLYHPCQLSHYSLLVGGLAGAERLGFEVNYWGEAVTESLLRTAADRAAGQTILFAPNLAPFQVPGVDLTSPSLARREVSLVGWDRAQAAALPRYHYAIIYRRKANLDSVPPAFLEGRVIAEVAHQGVWIARLVELPREKEK